MRRKRILHTGVASIFAFFLALTGCSKSDNEYLEEPDVAPESNEVIEPEQEVLYGKTGELFVKRAPVLGLTAIMQYTNTSTTTYMAATGNASLVGLDDTVFTVNASKENASHLPGLNKTKYITLYADKDDGHGSYFEVGVNDGYQITSIKINIKQNTDHTVTVGGESVAGVDNIYTINASSFRVQNTHTSDTTQFQINSVEITYQGPAASEVAGSLVTRSSLSYSYSKSIDDVFDTLVKSNTYDLSSGSGYRSWTNSDLSSGVSYTGNTSNNYSSVQMTAGSGSGIITKINSYRSNIKKVTVSWNSHTNSARVIDVYGKNEPYSAISDLYGTNVQKGESLGSIAFEDKDPSTNETSLEISGTYKYIGIRSHSDALYADSIEIQWEVPTFTYSDVAIRFGGFIKKTLWDRLNTESSIQGYGVMVSTAEYLDSSTIKGKYDLARESVADVNAAISSICSGGNIKNYYNAIPDDVENPDLATSEQKGELTGDYYIWNLYKKVASANLTKEFTAVAYIMTSSEEVVFLNEESYSAKSLAYELIDSGTDVNAYDESLSNLANLA